LRTRQNRSTQRLTRQRAVLVALSYDLMQPLVQIKTSLELMESSDFARPTVTQQANTMALSTQTGLQLAEAYRLLLKSDEILNLPLEAVPVGTILEETAHQLSPFAKQFSTELIIDIQGRFAPVLTHQHSLATTLEVLAGSMIQAQAAQVKRDKYQLVLGAHKTAEGDVATGVFCQVEGLSDRSLKAARRLVGQARQPMPAMPPGSISGILIADMLCAALWQPLRPSAHRSLGGLAVNLPLTSQLQFV